MWSACIPLTTESAASQNETWLAEMKLSGKNTDNKQHFRNESGISRSIYKQVTAEMAKSARLVQTSRTNLPSGKGLAEQVLKQIQYQHPHKN